MDLSRLMGSLMTLTFNGVTDKKSSWILIYLKKGRSIYTENDGIDLNECID